MSSSTISSLWRPRKNFAVMGYCEAGIVSMLLKAAKKAEEKQQTSDSRSGRPLHGNLAPLGHMPMSQARSPC